VHLCTWQAIEHCCRLNGEQYWLARFLAELPDKGLSVRKTYTSILLAVFLLFALSGCGYRPIVHDTEAVFGEGKTVSIPIFVNKTYKPNLENILANDLVDEFAKRKGLRIVSSEAADYTLTGEVVSYGIGLVSFSAFDAIKEYRSTMKVLATFRKNSTQRVLWKKEVTWSQDYPSSADIALQQNAEDAAIQEICRHLAQQIYLKTIEDF
jgi:hypothetical protein